jgi:hypothetical protein
VLGNGHTRRGTGLHRGARDRREWQEFNCCPSYLSAAGRVPKFVVSKHGAFDHMVQAKDPNFPPILSLYFAFFYYFVKKNQHK